MPKVCCARPARRTSVPNGAGSKYRVRSDFVVLSSVSAIRISHSLRDGVVSTTLATRHRFGLSQLTVLLYCCSSVELPRVSRGRRDALTHARPVRVPFSPRRCGRRTAYLQSRRRQLRSCWRLSGHLEPALCGTATRQCCPSRRPSSIPQALASSNWAGRWQRPQRHGGHQPSRLRTGTSARVALTLARRRHPASFRTVIAAGRRSGMQPLQ